VRRSCRRQARNASRRRGSRSRNRMISHPLPGLDPSGSPVSVESRPGCSWSAPSASVSSRSLLPRVSQVTFGTAPLGVLLLRLLPAGQFPDGFRDACRVGRHLPGGAGSPERGPSEPLKNYFFGSGLSWDRHGNPSRPARPSTRRPGEPGKIVSRRRTAASSDLTRPSEPPNVLSCSERTER
jgi:hypothetical protein